MVTKHSLKMDSTWFQPSEIGDAGFPQYLALMIWIFKDPKDAPEVSCFHHNCEAEGEIYWPQHNHNFPTFSHISSHLPTIVSHLPTIFPHFPTFSHISQHFPTFSYISPSLLGGFRRTPWGPRQHKSQVATEGLLPYRAYVEMSKEKWRSGTVLNWVGWLMDGLFHRKTHGSLDGWGHSGYPHDETETSK